LSKNVPLLERFFLQPLIPALRISELLFEKRYKSIRAANQLNQPKQPVNPINLIYPVKYRQISVAHLTGINQSTTSTNITQDIVRARGRIFGVG
jgi:hypothetical protein